MVTLFSRSLNKKKTDSVVDRKEGAFELVIQDEVVDEIGRDIEQVCGRPTRLTGWGNLLLPTLLAWAQRLCTFCASQFRALPKCNCLAGLCCVCCRSSTRK